MIPAELLCEGGSCGAHYAGHYYICKDQPERLKVAHQADRSPSPARTVRNAMADRHPVFVAPQPPSTTTHTLDANQIDEDIGAGSGTTGPDIFLDIMHLTLVALSLKF